MSLLSKKTVNKALFGRKQFARVYGNKQRFIKCDLLKDQCFFFLQIFRKSVEFCNEHEVWKLNVAHVLFMQVRLRCLATVWLKLPEILKTVELRRRALYSPTPLRLPRFLEVTDFRFPCNFVKSELNRLPETLKRVRFEIVCTFIY